MHQAQEVPRASVLIGWLERDFWRLGPLPQNLACVQEDAVWWSQSRAGSEVLHGQSSGLLTP